MKHSNKSLKFETYSSYPFDISWVHSLNKILVTKSLYQDTFEELKLNIGWQKVEMENRIINMANIA